MTVRGRPGRRRRRPGVGRTGGLCWRDRLWTAARGELGRWGGRGHLGARAARGREGDPDRQSAAWVWVRVESGVVRGRDRPHDREPEPGAVVVAGPLGQPLEGLEETLELVGRDRWTGVCDRQEGAFVAGAGGDRQAPASDVVADRVVDAVADQAFE